MVRIANMSKRSAAWFILCLSINFLIAISLLLIGLIFVEADTQPSWALPLIIVGAVLVFLTTFNIMLATISSNYVEKRIKNKETTK